MSSENLIELEVDNGTADHREVEFVCMEDVKPVDRDTELLVEIGNEDVETIEEEWLEDEDSNIGSMVSISSVEAEERSEQKPQIIREAIIIPNAEKNPPTENTENDSYENETTSSTPVSWPTLEILPGGVINLTEKKEDEGSHEQNQEANGTEMYACGKCSQSFSCLFTLVKHVRTHQDEARKIIKNQLTSLSQPQKEYLNLKRKRLEMEKNVKQKKLEVLDRLAFCLENLDQDFFA